MNTNRFTDHSFRDSWVEMIHDLQDNICTQLEIADGKERFAEDTWDRVEGGSGKTRVIANGNIFEKGGVNTSVVFGDVTETMRRQLKIEGNKWFACGISIVIHPYNPFVPTIHCNYRMFELYDNDETLIDRWFGGGADLTPYYLFEEDAVHFHRTCKTACDKHDPAFYNRFKKQCDEYFRNTHRNEARGIGGLFFDHCKADKNFTMKQWYNFVTEVGNSFLDAYVPIVEKRKDLKYTTDNRTWQEIRRGRYVEFNLVHDKGTLFGLKTNGRIESILMSLPPHVQWVYDHHPEEGSEEEKLINVLQNPVEWIHA